jgi:hypothetical protein
MADPSARFTPVERPEDGQDLLWDTLCQGEVEAVNTYLAWAATQLGLSHWHIYLAWEPAVENATACIQVERLKLVAPVQVCLDWVTREPAEQAEALLHEVLHVAHMRMTNVVSDEMYDHFTAGHQMTLDALHYRIYVEGERMVDGLARGLVKSLDAVAVWNEIRRECGAPADEAPPVPYEPTSTRPNLVAVTTDDSDQK